MLVKLTSLEGYEKNIVEHERVQRHIPENH